ncbi:ComEA family DNA-binding protein [Bacteroidota bacterium]
MKTINYIKEYFYFTRSERNGIRILIVIMTCLFFVPGIISSIIPEEKIDFSDFKNELEGLLISLDNPAKKEHQSKNISSVQQDYFSFDPNTASKQELIKLGFSKKTVNTIKSYLKAGGRFYEKKDLLKIYGLNEDKYSDLEPYINIKKEYRSENILNMNIDLNSSDSSEFINLPGIGPKLAKRIVKFRNLLGGFIIKDQMLEVYGIKQDVYENIKERIFIDTLKIIKIDINFANIKDLSRHPYLDYQNARKIINYRSQKGMFSHVNELNSNDLLNDSIFSKVSGYIMIRKKFE